MGEFVPLRNTERCIEGTFTKQTGSGSSDNFYCNEKNMCLPKSKLCSEPITVDGKTYKTVIAVNKQLPGPTLIVREGQIVAVDVHNNLSTEGITIHWHGQHQIKTNFMDAVGLVTQCPIQPGSSFRYIFKAGPSGTFWYHSEMQSQRGIGLFGALKIQCHIHLHSEMIQLIIH
jgi:FtsP/CotA-like multicopper oxidase with cupredoxin domain